MTESPDSKLELSNESSEIISTETTPQPSVPWVWHNKEFGNVLGLKPQIELLIERSEPFAHEAGVFFRDTDELFITSNRLVGSNGEQHVQISKVLLADTRKPSFAQKPEILNAISRDLIQMGNGGVNYKDGILFCAQGSRTTPSGLYWMDREAPHKTRPLLTSYHGVPFNSVNDVVVSKIDGSIWFTDPPYGAEQGYKNAAQLPPQVYIYHNGDADGFPSIRAVADGFGHPNGLCFSPDESVLYVTDTDKQHGSGKVRCDHASSIYAHDIVRHSGHPTLINRRLFAFVEAGIPDGIKCDTTGRVYSGCGDGIHVWSSSGILLGRIQIAGGVANFCFGRPGELYALNEERLWRIRLADGLTGALLTPLKEHSTKSPDRRRKSLGVRFWRWVTAQKE